MTLKEDNNHPDLKALDELFENDEEPEKDVIAAKNFNIAPAYREYKFERNKIFQKISNENQLNNKIRRQKILQDTREYNRFYLQKWDIDRKIRDL